MKSSGTKPQLKISLLKKIKTKKDIKKVIPLFKKWLRLNFDKNKLLLKEIPLKINHNEDEMMPLSLFKTEIMQKNRYGKKFFFIAKNIQNERSNISKIENLISETSLKEKIDRKKIKKTKIINKLPTSASLNLFLENDLLDNAVIKNVKKSVKNISIVKE